MTDTIPARRCESCHARFLQRAGGCPRCGSHQHVGVEAPSQGSVLAAVELLATAPGWTAPHRIVLVELGGDLRLLAVADRLPSIGETVTVAVDGTRYRLTG